MSQKVIQIGSSVGITIPRAILEEMRVQVGDAVEVSAHPEQHVISIKPQKGGKAIANKDLVVWAEDAIKRYRPALDALADK